jgi:hypothetical protein
MPTLSSNGEWPWSQRHERNWNAMAWLLPVGTPGGICSGLDKIPDGSGLVRLGKELMNLDEPFYRVWRACGAAPEVEELLAWASAQEIPDSDDAFRSMVSAGILVEGGQDVEARIGPLAIRLLGECIGNGPDRGSEFGVLGRDGARVEVDPYSFEALLRCDGVTPLSVVCGELEEAQPDLGRQFCLRRLSAGLPILVRAGIVRLDVGREP